MKITKYISKILNSFRLIGKFRHKYRVKSSKKVIKTIKEIMEDKNNGGRAISYLRKINPYVFEEVILTAIEESNVRVVRNKQYSNDGGIDGRISTKVGKILIQCKRYKSYINNKDVIELVEKVEENKCAYGVFAHTGKTGGKAKSTAIKSEKILYLSGSNLISLITGENHILEILYKRFPYS